MEPAIDSVSRLSDIFKWCRDVWRQILPALTNGSNTLCSMTRLSSPLEIDFYFIVDCLRFVQLSSLRYTGTHISMRGVKFDTYSVLNVHKRYIIAVEPSYKLFMHVQNPHPLTFESLKSMMRVQKVQK